MEGRIRGLETTLSIGIDMGSVDSGVLESSGGVYGVRGDVKRAMTSAECPSEKVV